MVKSRKRNENQTDDILHPESMESKSKEIKLDQKINYSLDKIPVLSYKSLIFNF